jgi:hypothetical protein
MGIREVDVITRSRRVASLEFQRRDLTDRRRGGAKLFDKHPADYPLLGWRQVRHCHSHAQKAAERPSTSRLQRRVTPGSWTAQPHGWGGIQAVPMRTKPLTIRPHHRIPSNVKHLRINAAPVCAEFPSLQRLVDRVHDGAKGFFFSPIMPYKRVQVVSRVGENVIPLVWIICTSGSHISPSVGRARARR